MERNATDADAEHDPALIADATRYVVRAIV